MSFGNPQLKVSTGAQLQPSPDPNAVPLPNTDDNYRFSESQLPLSVANAVSLVAPVASPSGDTTGATDTPVIQAAINGCPSGGTVALQPGVYYINAALTIPKSVTLRGAGIAEVYGTRANSDGTQLPGVAPWIQGTVITQVTAATNGITVTATGLTVHLRDFGITFGSSIIFQNTGHGIYAVPSTADGTGLENGLVSARWDNLVVFGHDGNHYAFYTLNNNYTTSTHLRSYGGGGWYMETNSQYSGFGNGLVTSTYFAVICGGSADGFHQKSGTTQFPGTLNLMTYIRPQANLVAAAGPLASAYPVLTSTPPVNTQHTWQDVGTPNYIRVIAPDLEHPTSGGFPAPAFGSQTYVEPAGGIFDLGTSYLSKAPRRSTPTIVVGAAAGTGATAAISNFQSVTGATDDRFQIDINAGTSPYGGEGAACASVTFGAPMLNGPGAILFQPVYPAGNAYAAEFYPKNVTKTGFEVWSHAGMTASVQHSFAVLIVE